MDVVRAYRKGTGRKRMKPRKDKRAFRVTANRTRVENVIGNPMRGGTRL